MHATVPATVVPTAVVGTATVVSAAPSVEAATPAVKTALSPTSVTAAVLGKRGCTNESHGSGYGEKSLQQGGFPHLGPST